MATHAFPLFCWLASLLTPRLTACVVCLCVCLCVHTVLMSCCMYAASKWECSSFPFFLSHCLLLVGCWWASCRSRSKHWYISGMMLLQTDSSDVFKEKYYLLKYISSFPLLMNSTSTLNSTCIDGCHVPTNQPINQSSNLGIFKVPTANTVPETPYQ